MLEQPDCQRQVFDHRIPYQTRRLPDQRWQIAAAQPERADQLGQALELSPLLAQVLLNRGIETPEQAQVFLDPESLALPPPLTEFPDLAASLELLQSAIAAQQKIAICGDYDADGMTSTALLLRALRSLGAQVDYAIPSRMHEGYGINRRIVEDFHAEGVSLILTVDNGIAAAEPIARARELGLAVIVTDHHDLPPDLPPANAILNPKLLPMASPYRSLAGVGVAYILAVCLAQQLGQTQSLWKPLLELFTLGTIADLAPLTGVNRRWIRRGLQLLPRSEFAGVQALIQVAGLSPDQGKSLKPEAIGFRLGPRINAVGRIGDPQTVIELLTTDDPGVALERAMQCEQANRERQQLCEQIEQEALDWCESSQIDLQAERVLVVVQPHWHHGVIGIVASRLVERYGVPVFIGTYEDEAQTQIRGSARGIPEFDVFAALQFCQDILGKFGGHRAAGGFSLAADQLPKLRSRLRTFAHQCLQPQYLKPLIRVDVQASFDQLDGMLYQQMDQFQPCGIENGEPVFWTPQVRILEQQRLGKKLAHLKLTLAQGQKRLKAMAWRWGTFYPLPEQVDLAYQLRENVWNNRTTLELEVVGIQIPAHPQLPVSPQPDSQRSSASPVAASSDQLVLECPDPPCTGEDAWLPQWSELESLEELPPELAGNLLVYGAQRPYLSVASTDGRIEYDRPSQPCEHLLLWTLPPSWTHLRWLLALSQPRHIYVRNDVPPLPTVAELRSQLKLHLAKFPGQPLNLLHLGQQWWVAPCTLVAILRELGHPCPQFPATCSPEQELKRLQRWYLYPAGQLASLS